MSLASSSCGSRGAITTDLPPWRRRSRSSSSSRFCDVADASESLDPSKRSSFSVIGIRCVLR